MMNDLKNKIKNKNKIKILKTIGVNIDEKSNNTN